MKPTGIIVLEGANASGKTTLAKALRERYDARYVHLGLYKNPWRWHLGALWRAIKLSQDHLVIIDRHWISECAYAQVFRDGSTYPVAARCLDRILKKHCAAYVMCVPSNYLEHVARHKKRINHPYPDITGVIQFYSDLVYGNLAQPGTDYASQLARRGDFLKRADTMIFDMDHDGDDGMDKVLKQIVTRVRWLQFQQFDGARNPYNNNITGHAFDATHVIVAEAPGCHPLFRGVGWPFTDRSGPAHFMNQALHYLDADESKLIFTSVHGTWDMLPALAAKKEGIRSLLFICTGRVGERRLKDLGVEAWQRQRIVHPIHAATFTAHGEGPIKRYARVLGQVLHVENPSPMAKTRSLLAERSKS